MSNLVIALVFSVGASAWVFTKLQRQTGNNTRNSAIGTAITAIVLFLLIFIVLGTFFKN